jgi:hypothetical protein
LHFHINIYPALPEPTLKDLRRSSHEDTQRKRSPGPVRSNEPRDRMGGAILPSRKEKTMNAYPEEFLREYDVKETISKTKSERDVEARQLRKDGWEVTTKRYYFDGDERFFLTAIRRKEQSL